MSAAAPGWTSNAEAVQAFTDDVLAVGLELGLAGTVAAFGVALRELIEITTDHHVLVDDHADGSLVVRTGTATLRLTVHAPCL